MKLSEIVLLENTDQTFNKDLDAAVFVLKNCSEWKDFSLPLWRYTKDSNKFPPRLRSTRIRENRSKGGTEDVQDYIFSLPEYKGFPDRAQSIFCSTTHKVAIPGGEYKDDMTIVFPLNGTKMAQTEAEDFNYSRVALKNDTRMSIGTVKLRLFQVCHTLGIHANYNTSEIQDMIEEIKDFKGSTEDIFSEPLEQEFFDLVNNDEFKDLFLPERLGIEVVTPGTIKKLGVKQTEVWLEGKYIAIPFPWFAPIVKLINRLKSGETEEDIRAEGKIPKTFTKKVTK